MGPLLSSHFFGGYAFSGLRVFKIINRYHFSAFWVQPLLCLSVYSPFWWAQAHLKPSSSYSDSWYPCGVFLHTSKWAIERLRSSTQQHTHPYTHPLHLLVSCLIPSCGYCMYICAWSWYSKLVTWFKNKGNRNVRSSWALPNGDKCIHQTEKKTLHPE